MRKMLPKIIFNLDEPHTVELRYPQPKEIERDLHNYYLYGVEEDEESKIFFASQNLHEEIEKTGATKGNLIEIVKKQSPNGWQGWECKIVGRRKEDTHEIIMGGGEK